MEYMKKRSFIAACAAALSLFGLAAWEYAHTDTKDPDSIHELEHISIYAEEKGASYAADRLDYLMTYSYTKADPREKWGAPNEGAADRDEDIWRLSDGYRLIIDYDTTGRVIKIEVQATRK